MFVQTITIIHELNFKACCSCWCCYTSQFPVTQNLPTHPRDSSSRISKPENTPFYFLCYFHFSLLLLHMLLKGIQWKVFYLFSIKLSLLSFVSSLDNSRIVAKQPLTVFIECTKVAQNYDNIPCVLSLGKPIFEYRDKKIKIELKKCIFLNKCYVVWAIRSL